MAAAAALRSRGGGCGPPGGGGGGGGPPGGGGGGGGPPGGGGGGGGWPSASKLAAESVGLRFSGEAGCEAPRAAWRRLGEARLALLPRGRLCDSPAALPARDRAAVLPPG